MSRMSELDLLATEYGIDKTAPDAIDQTLTRARADKALDGLWRFADAMREG